ncbi:MAG: sugar-phosphatase [Oleiphilaceae bacterium]|jgi:sugar-phosphatase
MTMYFEIQCKAFLFDLDATLVDSTICIENIWRRWSIIHGQSFEDTLKASHGSTIINTLNTISPKFATEQCCMEVQDIAIQEMRNAKEIKGAAKLLEKIYSEPWAVVTSSNRAIAIAQLAHAGLPEPPVLIAAEDVVHAKPHPEPYLIAANLLNVTISDCLIFEDSPIGIKSGLDSGAKVVVVSPHCLKITIDEISGTIGDFENVTVKARYIEQNYLVTLPFSS